MTITRQNIITTKTDYCISRSEPVEQRLLKLRKMCEQHKYLTEELRTMFPSGTHKLHLAPGQRSGTYEPERWSELRERQVTTITSINKDICLEKESIAKILRHLDKPRRDILVWHYLLNRPIKAIAKELNYTPRYINLLKQNALLVLSKIAS